MKKVLLITGLLISGSAFAGLEELIVNNLKTLKEEKATWENAKEMLSLPSVTDKVCSGLGIAGRFADNVLDATYSGLKKTNAKLAPASNEEFYKFFCDKCGDKLLAKGDKNAQTRTCKYGKSA